MFESITSSRNVCNNAALSCLQPLAQLILFCLRYCSCCFAVVFHGVDEGGNVFSDTVGGVVADDSVCVCVYFDVDANFVCKAYAVVVVVAFFWIKRLMLVNFSI